MPITTTCPGCGKQMEAPDKAAGRKARCPHCRSVVEIPGEAAAAAPGEAVSAEVVEAALARSATLLPLTGSATTIDRLVARTSPYGLLRLMAPILLGLGIGLGGVVFLVGLASLIVVARRGSPLLGVVAFVGGLVVAALLVLGGKILSDLVRLGADLGDKTRFIVQYLEETQSRRPTGNGNAQDAP
ncbi:MAG: hypothetical protein WBD63_05575 [Phycisphaerae bacterium]|nr:hypothetical protein [Phycisphaerae bacterium]